jgi:CrcB protein
VLAVIGLGGALGALLRDRVSGVLPHAAGQLPWSTLLVNVVGCALIGVFMAVITERAVSHRLLRPFVGVGVLGGLTTFSTYAVDVVELVLAGRPRSALGYLARTVVAALAAVVLGVVGMRAVLRWTRAEGGRR